MKKQQLRSIVMSPAIEQENRTANAAPLLRDPPGLILVVEDDDALRRLIEKCLAVRGDRTVGVSNGAAALAWLEQNTPDLMLLDYSLPDMHGEQLLRQIKARGKQVSFVVATGHGSESVAVEMMKHGAYDYVVKGAAFMLLLPPVIDRALERARQAKRLAEAEEELRRAHDELERRVEQRTAELAEVNRRLRIEIDERRRAEDRAQQHLAELAHVARLSTVGEMMAELAHELNQPLSAICSHAQACKRLLASGDRDYVEDLSASLNQVNEQGTRAAEIIRRVRRFVVKAKPSEAVVDVNAMIRDVAELMSIDARMAGAETVLELAEPLPPVVGDRIQLEQVLVNLMRNGFEALRESDRQRRLLTVGTSLDGSNTIVVTVRDNGGGIASDVLDRIFERFFTTKAGGMGMGLSVSQSIIKSHGGTLRAAPVPEGGAVFHFTLPIQTGEQSHGN
jgi:C4-dicarboxylate-specific signal transduction histidine kinase